MFFTNFWFLSLHVSGTIKILRNLDERLLYVWVDEVTDESDESATNVSLCEIIPGLMFK